MFTRFQVPDFSVEVEINIALINITYCVSDLPVASWEYLFAETTHPLEREIALSALCILGTNSSYNVI